MGKRSSSTPKMKSFESARYVRCGPMKNEYAIMPTGAERMLVGQPTRGSKRESLHKSELTKAS